MASEIFRAATTFLQNRKRADGRLAVVQAILMAAKACRYSR
jgi:hypothetical protein